MNTEEPALTEPKRLRSVRVAAAPFTLRLEWDDGAWQDADLGGLISRSRHFGAFRDDPDAFARVRVANWGHGVEWDNGLDYAAQNLARIADEQRHMDAEDFKAWQDAMDLTNPEAGDVLGYKLAQIKNFRSGDAAIPVAVRIACRALAQDKTAFFAHVHPRRKAGRPQKETAA